MYGAAYINTVKNWLIRVVDDTGREKLNSGKARELDDVAILRSATRDFAVNMADGVQLEDESETPLQFIYQAADCRLFHTPEMITDGSKAWKAAARVMNGDYEMCVRNSTNHPTSVTGSGNATIPAPGKIGDESSPAVKDGLNAGLRTAISKGLLFTLPVTALLLI